MMTISFDTQQVAKLLTTNGYTQEQADGMIAVVKELNLDKLATKDDLKVEVDKIDLRFRSLESSVDLKLQTFEHKIVNKKSA